MRAYLNVHLEQEYIYIRLYAATLLFRLVIQQTSDFRLLLED